MRVLFIGAHCDDIELACGGTIAKYADKWEIVCYTCSVASPLYGDLSGVQRTSLERLGVKDIRFGNFQTREFSQQRQDIWLALSNLMDSVRPNIVFAHGRERHQDHEMISAEIRRCCTPSTSIISYYITDQFISNMFIGLTKAEVAAKLESLSCYKMYVTKPYFQSKTIEASMVANAASTPFEFAESFKIRKLITTGVFD